MRSPLLHCLFPLVALLGIVGCTPTPPQEKSETPKLKVTYVPAIVEATQDYDDYVGKLEASESVEVRARVAGFIREVRFLDGAFVKEGDVLYLIEPDEYVAINKQAQAKVVAATAQEALAAARIERNRKLIESNAVTREAFDEMVAAQKEAEASKIVAIADAERAALDLKYTEVTSPISGRVDRTLLSKGALVTGGPGSATLLTKVVNVSPIYAYFEVDDRSMLRYQRMATQATAASTDPEIRPSLRDRKVPCFVQLQDETEFKHEGKLDFIQTSIDPATSTVKIRAELTNADRLMISGMFVRIRIPVGPKYDAVMIPEQSIATDQTIKYVYVVNDSGKVERRDIELGGSRGSWRIVKSGLQGDDRVILRGIQRVRPEQEVEVEQEKVAPPPASSLLLESSAPSASEPAKSTSEAAQ